MNGIQIRIRLFCIRIRIRYNAFGFCCTPFGSHSIRWCAHSVSIRYRPNSIRPYSVRIRMAFSCYSVSIRSGMVGVWLAFGWNSVIIRSAFGGHSIAFGSYSAILGRYSASIRLYWGRYSTGIWVILGEYSVGIRQYWAGIRLVFVTSAQPFGWHWAPCFGW